MSRSFGFLIARNPPSRTAGVLTATALVGVCTMVVYPLAELAPVVSLSVVYLPAVLFVSIVWGAWLGVLAGVMSALAFDFFHLAPVGRLTINDSRMWVALAAFVVATALASSVSEIARARTRDAEDRRREADLVAQLARLLLSGDSLSQALPTVAARLAGTLELHSAAIEMEAVQGDERTIAFPLRDGTRTIGTLLVGADSPQTSLRRLKQRVVPSLEAVLGPALERERLMAGAVDAAALRRADNVKTALLRSVSHDLRSPLTAISAAAEALQSRSLSDEERTDMVSVIGGESRRLSRLIENLLDLSRLQAGAAGPRREWCSIEELLGEAVGEIRGEEGQFRLSIDPELPLVSLDPAQMSRAFVNVLENARRHSRGQQVSVRARAVHGIAGGERIVIRVVDRGPGIAPGQLEEVFQPFYRAPGAGDHGGSGLGLAIARGFTEANGGTLHVESLPGQGSTFVFELPLAGSLAPELQPRPGLAGQESLFDAVSGGAEAAAEPQPGGLGDRVGSGVG
ncbi:MAG TPA: ATP-binding protein [Solirubrobacteraceae bacterium]|nr:ATP-binding protein [Solirubrobacteraceae bacterium]